MDADLDTLATALYVTADDLLKSFPEHLPWRPTVGITPRISDADMVTASFTQCSLGVDRGVENPLLVLFTLRNIGVELRRIGKRAGR